MNQVAKGESRWLQDSLKMVAAAKNLEELFKIYQRRAAIWLEHGWPGEDRKLWQAYYSRIGSV